MLLFLLFLLLLFFLFLVSAFGIWKNIEDHPKYVHSRVLVTPVPWVGGMLF